MVTVDLPLWTSYRLFLSVLRHRLVGETQRTGGDMINSLCKYSPLLLQTMIGLHFPLTHLFCVLMKPDWLRSKSIPETEVRAFTNLSHT